MLVALDTDAICACKILQYLFQCDHIFYTIIPVAGHEDIQKAFIENAEGVSYFTLSKLCLDVCIADLRNK